MGLEPRSCASTGEEAKDMKATQGRFHWDKRHKRYVQLQPDEKLRGTGKRKTESGGVVRSPSNLAVTDSCRGQL